MRSKHPIMLCLLSMCPLYKTSVSHFWQCPFWIFKSSWLGALRNSLNILVFLSPLWYRERVWLDALTALLMKMHVFWWTRRLDIERKEGRKDRNKQNKNIPVRPRSLFTQLRGDRNICTQDVYQKVFRLLHIKELQRSCCWLVTEKYSTYYDYTLYLYVQNTNI